MRDWRSFLWYEANYWATWAAFTLGFSFRSQGSRHVPRRGPVLLVANHESFLDPLAVGLAVRRHIRYLARKTLFRPEFFGKYLRSVGCVPVDQEGIAKEGIRTCLDLLQAGEAILVFPEGERTLTGEMLPFKPGVSLLLKKAQVPVLPIGVAGAYEAYPRTARVPRLSPLFWPATGAAVAVSIGKPIPPDHYRAVPREEILQDLFRAVQAEVKQAERLRRGNHP
jgi:1-acyl-sn-glycerol-3-phosphate acyltransferase